jgi:hypothetical protein
VFALHVISLETGIVAQKIAMNESKYASRSKSILVDNYKIISLMEKGSKIKIWDVNTGYVTINSPL